MKKVYGIAAAVLALAVIAFFIVRADSAYLALKGAGIEANGIEDLAHGVDANGRDFRIIKTSTEKHEIMLANLEKNGWGFWTVFDKSDEITDDPHFTVIAWILPGNSQFWYVTDSAKMSFEWHQIYCGDNAAKLIEFQPGQIPENVTLDIWQAGSNYWIHVISFAEPEVLNSFDVKALLVKNGCIP